MKNQINEQIKELQNIKFDKNEIIELEKKIESIKKEKEILNELNLKINSEISSLNFKNDENKKLELKLSNLEICPTCLQGVDSVYRANVLNKLYSETSENKSKIESLTIEKKETIEKIKKSEEKISQVQEKIQDLKLLSFRIEETKEKQKRIFYLENLNLQLEKDVTLLTQHNESLKNLITDLEKYSSFFELKKKELEEALREEKFAEIKIAELKKEIEFFLIQIKSLKNKIKQSEEIKKQLHYIVELENWLSKKFVSVISFIEKNIMIKLKLQFSELFSEWFLMLVSDSFNVGLTDNFTPIIEQQDYEIDYEYLSGGERTAVALAYRLSLNQVINSLLSKIKTKDIVILDEPTDGFSEQQLDKMRDVLQQLNAKQLIIVSHEQKIDSFVENIIKFKKESGISGIEE